MNFMFYLQTFGESYNLMENLNILTGAVMAKALKAFSCEAQTWLMALLSNSP